LDENTFEVCAKDLNGLTNLWQIVLLSDNKTIIENAIELLASCYINYNYKIRNSLKQQQEKLITNSIENIKKGFDEKNDRIISRTI